MGVKVDYVGGAQAEAKLIALGAEGWELVAVYHDAEFLQRFILKRPR